MYYVYNAHTRINKGRKMGAINWISEIKPSKKATQVTKDCAKKNITKTAKPVEHHYPQLILFACKGEVQRHVNGNQGARTQASNKGFDDELTVVFQLQNAGWHEVILARLTSSGTCEVCCRWEMSQVNTMPCRLVLCSWLSSSERSFTALGSPL